MTIATGRARAVVVIGLAAVGLLSGAGAAAHASEKDLKDAIKAFEAVAPDDATALAAAAARLARTEPPRGALELVQALDHADRRVALAAQAALSKAGDARTTRALAGRLADLRGARARRLLAGALATVPGDEIGRALVRALDDKDALVRAAAARSLAGRDATTAAIASGILRERALRDPSPRVRQAAEAARVRLGQPSLGGFDVVPRGPLALPSRFFATRVAFLLDASDEAREAAFAPPEEPRGHPARPDAAAVGSKAPLGPRKVEPATISAFELAGQAVASAVLSLDDDQQFDVVAFHERPLSFAPRFAKATARATGEAREWLRARHPASDVRDVVRALRDALERQPAPDEIHLTLAGAPAGRGIETDASGLVDLAWDRGVPIHVVLVAPDPARPPRDERDALERARAEESRRRFAESLAAGSGGRFTLLPLARAAPDDGSPAPLASAAKTASEGSAAVSTRTRPTLVNGRIPRSDLAAVRRRVDEALRARDPEQDALVTELAAAPDDAAFELALRALLHGSLDVQTAVLEGLSRNREPRVHEALARELRAQTDPRRALVVARALAACPGPAVARALALEAERREGSSDLPRFLLGALASRPRDELAPLASEVASAARRPRTGFAAAHAARAVERAAGRTAEPPALPDDRLLPERFDAGAVAFLVDVERAMDEVFVRPPAPPHPEKDRPGKPDKPIAPGAVKDADKDGSSPPPPLSRRDVAARELERALEVLGRAKGSANLHALAEGGRGLRAHPAPVTKAFLADARAWLERLPISTSREVARPIERALDDPDVEEVWVLASGLPVRSDSDRDETVARERIRAAAFRRGVAVHVVLVLGEVTGDDAKLAEASRRDEVRTLTAFWRPLALATGGTFAVREKALTGPRPAAPVARPPAPATPRGPENK